MNVQSRVTRQWLQKQFQPTGIQLESAALAKLVRVVEEAERPEAIVNSLLDEIETCEC